MRVRTSMKWVMRVVVALAAVYVAFFGAVLAAMLQPPERFGAFMRHVPEAAVWRGLPASHMWLWARRGALAEGDFAPDFTLSTVDHSRRVTLSSFTDQRPVVLVFGSYT
jgi:hypothetical protein